MHCFLRGGESHSNPPAGNQSLRPDGSSAARDPALPLRRPLSEEGSEKQERTEYSIYLYSFSGEGNNTAGAGGSRGAASSVRGQPGLGSPGRRSSSGAARGAARPGPWLTCAALKLFRSFAA